MKKTTITFHFNSPQRAEIIAHSLIPELKKNIPHTTIEMKKDRTTLTLTIKANQTNSLRAACNSYIRWIQTALSVHKKI